MKNTHKIVVSLAGVVLLITVLVVVAVSFRAFRQTKEAAEARKHTFVVMNSADELLSALRDAETGQRGYSLTGDEAFLEPYLAVRDSISGHLEELRQLTLISAAHKHLDAVAPLMVAKLEEMAHVIELRRNDDMPAVLAVVRSGQGKQLMDSIRAEMKSFTEIEQGALAQHDAEFQANMRLLFIIIVTASLFTLLFAISFTYLIYRETQNRLKNLVHLETQHLLEIQEDMNKQLQQANATLQISEQKLSVTLYSIGDAVIATDNEGRVTLLNPLAEQLTGWMQAEATGHPVDEIFHIINQETRQPATIPIKETLAHGTIQGLANHTVLIARDGCECAIADSCAPIRDRDGQVVGAVMVFHDVTEEYAARQALHDSAALVKTILNTVVDSIITFHARGGIVETVNPAAERMFGYAAAELIGQGFSLLIPELDRSQRNGFLEYYSASDEARAINLGDEVVGRRKDGSIFPMEITVSEMWLGGQRHFTGILRDITARKQAEEALQETNIELESAKSAAEKANLAKSDFLSSMSHELRSPLNAILGFAQLMESDSPPPTPAQTESIAQILQAGWHLLKLIDEVLDLTKVESRQMSLSQEPVALAELMLECQGMIEPQAQQRGIGITFPQFDIPYFVKADRTRVKQVIINLLSNAIKYNREQGTVEVNCTVSTPGRIRFSIKDTGAGLSPEQQAQLFQPFNRLGQEAGGEEGTGIGLVVAKRLVELMGGIIGVESAVGAGSVFWFELNSADAPELSGEEAEPMAPAKSQVQSGTRLRALLYVEDNPANMKLVEQLVARRPDMSLLTAANGNSGIELARASQPAAILMDINLPDISGFEALKILRADPDTAHIPIVALSANAMPRDIEKGLQAGFFRYLTKPIKITEFMDALNVVMEFAEQNESQNK